MYSCYTKGGWKVLFSTNYIILEVLWIWDTFFKPCNEIFVFNTSKSIIYWININKWGFCTVLKEIKNEGRCVKLFAVKVRVLDLKKSLLDDIKSRESRWIKMCWRFYIFLWILFTFLLSVSSFVPINFNTVKIDYVF